MTAATDTDRLVGDYLRRLDAAAAHLQASRRAELVAEIREHIEAALRQAEPAGEAAVRNVLERLGEPDEIVAAAEPPPDHAPARTGRLELAALIALLVPFIGWLVGAVLVVVSRAWSGREKAVGAALLLLPLLLPLLAFVAEGGPDSTPAEAPGTPVVGDPGPAHSERATEGFGLEHLGLFAFVFLAGLPSALYLGWRLRRQAG